jgi:bleomycin hydrolase
MRFHRILFATIFILTALCTQAQVESIYDFPEVKGDEWSDKLRPEAVNFCTAIRNQGNTGTCWSFSAMALLESEMGRKKIGLMDFSEMFVVRNIYLEKARNYILRLGKAPFAQGALGHDALRAMERYGIITESAFSGLRKGMNRHDHDSLYKRMQIYLDSVLKKSSRGLEADWQPGFQQILDQYLGSAPATFQYNGKQYTPIKFAREVVDFHASDFVSLTSFSHVPFYEPYILEVPDNFSAGAYWNVPLNVLMELIESTIRSGYTVLWDADVSNAGFSAKLGLALHVPRKFTGNLDWKTQEAPWNETLRQQTFERLETQDDHLMQLVGIDQYLDNKQTYFRVKNSWGGQGPANGFLWASKAYLAMNTISIIIPKVAMDEAWKTKLKLPK